VLLKKSSPEHAHDRPGGRAVAGGGGVPCSIPLRVRLGQSQAVSEHVVRAAAAEAEFD